MKIVIAPDSFKESLSAAEVAQAIANGVLAVLPEAQIDLCPMADGGEGTVDAMIAATGGRFVTADVFDPLGQEIRAKFGLLGLGADEAMLPGEVGLNAANIAAEGQVLGDIGATAIIEMAAASGLGLLPMDKRNPMRTTTYGTGQLIMAAIEAGARQIILGIGGSGTTDGGCGCAQALGVTFSESDGEPCVNGLAGGALESIATIDLASRDERIAATDIRVACDVNNPLLGPEGAAAVYGPQKGATDEMVKKLETNLGHLAEIIREQLDLDINAIPGSGAAGGLGAGLIAFAGANLENGGKLIADAVRLPNRLRGADLCITGEGKIDAQSRFGKVPVRVASIAGQEGVSTICIAGLVAEDAPRELFSDLRALVEGNVSPEMSMTDPGPILTARTKEAMRDYLAK